MKAAGRISRRWITLLAILLAASLVAMAGVAPSGPVAERPEKAAATDLGAEPEKAVSVSPEITAEPPTTTALPAVRVVPETAAGAVIPTKLEQESSTPEGDVVTAVEISDVIDPQAPAPLPPYDLKGAQAPDPQQLYVVLAWKCDNPPGSLKGYNIYRVDLLDADILPILDKPYGASKKPYFEDWGVEAGHTYRYWVTAVSKKGVESKPSNTVDVYVDKVVVPSPPTGFAAWLVDPGVSLDWNPNLEPDIAGYNIYVSKKPNSARKKLNEALISGVHYYEPRGQAGLYYWVTAVNRKGLESEATMATPQATIPVIIEENDSSIQVEGLWVTEGYVGPTNGRIRVAGDAGARLRLVFEGSQVKVVVAKYWSCGSAVAYLDEKEVGVIDLYSESTTYNVIDLSLPGLARGKHELVIEALGSGNPQYPFNFVNVDCFEVR